MVNFDQEDTLSADHASILKGDSHKMNNIDTNILKGFISVRELQKNLTATNCKEFENDRVTHTELKQADEYMENVNFFPEKGTKIFFMTDQSSCVCS